MERDTVTARLVFVRTASEAARVDRLIGSERCVQRACNAVIRYKKGRPLCCNRSEREVGSSGGFAPRPPRFNALVPVRKLGKRKTRSFADPVSVPAPGSALGLLLSRALSSAQAAAIVAKRKRREKPWSECVRRPTSGRLPRQEYGQPFNESALNPEGSVVQ